MAKTLAIKVKFSSDGEEQVIKNVNELEAAIDSLNKDLKELDFGSEEYKRTASELKGLRSALKDVEKETEGLDVEQRLSAIGGARIGSQNLWCIGGDHRRGGEIGTTSLGSRQYRIGC
jgi:exonuclease VII small subunit